jgi:hypothetical protein
MQLDEGPVHVMAVYGAGNTSMARATNSRTRMKYWEQIADNLGKAGFSWDCSSEFDSTGRVIFTADAYARDGRRFTVLADERVHRILGTTEGNSSST